MNSGPQRILLIKNRAMGDSLMGLSTLQAIHHHFPSTEVYYALPGWIVPLYKHFDLPRTHFLPLGLGSVMETLNFYLTVRGINPDLIYEMHQAGRSAKFFSLYQKLHSCPYGFHNHHLKAGESVIDQGVIKPLIQRDLDGAMSFFHTQDLAWDYRQYVPQFPLKKKPERKQRLILGVVATRETKMYPLKLYELFAQKFLAENPDYEIVTPLSKSKADVRIRDQLIAEAPSLARGIVYWSLEELPERFYESKLYVGNDTGLKHLAIACGLKTLTLFGPEPPLEWHPYETLNHPYLYREGLECRTRKAHYCGLSHCDSMICLNEFSAEQLLASLRPLSRDDAFGGQGHRD